MRSSQAGSQRPLWGPPHARTGSGVPGQRPGHRHVRPLQVAHERCWHLARHRPLPLNSGRGSESPSAAAETPRQRLWPRARCWGVRVYCVDMYITPAHLADADHAVPPTYATSSHGKSLQLPVAPARSHTRHTRRRLALTPPLPPRLLGPTPVEKLCFPLQLASPLCGRQCTRQ